MRVSRGAAGLPQPAGQREQGRAHEDEREGELDHRPRRAPQGEAQAREAPRGPAHPQQQQQAHGGHGGQGEVQVQVLRAADERRAEGGRHAGPEPQGPPHELAPQAPEPPEQDAPEQEVGQGRGPSREHPEPPGPGQGHPVDQGGAVQLPPGQVEVGPVGGRRWRGELAPGQGAPPQQPVQRQQVVRALAVGRGVEHVDAVQDPGAGRGVGQGQDQGQQTGAHKAAASLPRALLPCACLGGCHPPSGGEATACPLGARILPPCPRPGKQGRARPSLVAAQPGAAAARAFPFDHRWQ